MFSECERMPMLDPANIICVEGAFSGFRCGPFEISVFDLTTIGGTDPLESWLRMIDDSFYRACEHFHDRFEKVV